MAACPCCVTCSSRTAQERPSASTPVISKRPPIQGSLQDSDGACVGRKRDLSSMIVTGMPLRAPLPDGSSRNIGGDSALVLAPGELLATDMRVPGLPCPQPCGIDTTPGLIASVISTGTLISPASDLTVTTSFSAMP